jgi:cell shape-determining protein MreC
VGSSTIPVVAEGRGSGNFYIKVPKNIPIVEGDQIITPGLRPIVLGTAEHVDTSEGEAFSHIYFKLPVKLNALHYVQIKKNIR